MRLAAQKYLAARARAAAALQLRNLIDGKMRDWTESQLTKWVGKNLPAAESAVARMPHAEGKRMMLAMMFEDHHRRIFEMVDGMRDNLISVGFDPALFIDEVEIEKEKSLEKGNDERKEEIKDDSGRERKDESERKFDVESDLGSDSRYNPSDDLPGGSRAPAQASARVRIPRRSKTSSNSNGSGNGNGSSHNDQFHHDCHNSALFNLRFSRGQNRSFQNGNFTNCLRMSLKNMIELRLLTDSTFPHFSNDIKGRKM